MSNPKGRPTGALEQRLWAKVDKTGDPSGCWLWTASRNPGGYGQIWANGKAARHAHRIAYELLVGPIPDDLELDHLCRVRHCVNPAHLEPVTHAENVRRGNMEIKRLAVIRGRTHCKRGHPFDDANTYVTPDGRRQCRVCMKLRRQTPLAIQKAKKLDVTVVDLVSAPVAHASK